MPTVATRVQQHRERLRKAGLRPVQIWVPDTRGANFAAECRRQSQIVAASDKADAELTAITNDALNDIKGWE
ncbi:antitoxin MazE family protein [Chromatiaceae bacterium AAb-1]|nr:antitoxin MazE family protein [Chromatiaceae bacterium AAb-1]